MSLILILLIPRPGVTERIPTVLPTGREGESCTCRRGAATKGSGNPFGTGKEGGRELFANTIGLVMKGERASDVGEECDFFKSPFEAGKNVNCLG